MSDATTTVGHWVDKSGYAYVESPDIAKRADELGLKYFPAGTQLPDVVEPEVPEVEQPEVEPPEVEPPIVNHTGAGIDLAPAGAPLTKAQKKAAEAEQAKLDAQLVAAEKAKSFESELNDLDLP